MGRTIAEIQLKYKPLKTTNAKITSSKDAYSCFKSSWDHETIELQEEFKLLLLNRSNEVLGIHLLSKGGISATVVDIKLLFVIAIKTAASSIIMAHNHPSGNLNPSECDKRLFEKIVKASKLLDINILDNLIISNHGYYSFADEGLI